MSQSSPRRRRSPEVLGNCCESFVFSRYCMHSLGELDILLARKFAFSTSLATGGALTGGGRLALV